MPSGTLHLKIGEARRGLYRQPFLWVNLRIGYTPEPNAADPANKDSKDPKWTMLVPAIVDTGADVTVIPSWLLRVLESKCNCKFRSEELLPDSDRRVMTAAGPIAYYNAHVMMELRAPAGVPAGSKLFRTLQLVVLEARDEENNPLPDDRQHRLALIGMDVLNLLGELRYVGKPTEGDNKLAHLRWEETGTHKRAAKNDRNIDL